MGILKDWLYFLTDEAGNSYRVDHGRVETTGTPTALPITPDGWQGKTIKYGRNLRYRGMFRSYTTPLRFVKQAATILRTLAITIGFEAKIFIVIHRLDRSFGAGWMHRLFFKGELDLSKLESDDDSVPCNVMEGGLDKLLKANESTTYEIELNEIIKHDGVKLQVLYNYQLIDDTITYATPENFIPIVSISESKFGLYPLNQTGSKMNENFSEKIVENVSESTIAITLEGSLSFTCPNGDTSFAVRIEVLDRNSDRKFFVLNTGFITADSWSDNLFYFINLAPGDYIRIYLVLPLAGTGPSGPDSTIDIKWGSDTFKITYDYRHPTSQVNCINPINLGQALIDKIAPGYKFASSYFQSEWLGLKITGGDAIRSLPGAKMKTSWNDFYDSMNAVTYCQSFIKGDTVYIERGSQAFGRTSRVNLGEAAAVKWGFADEDFIYNKVKSGYPDVKIEDINGRFEFNVTNSFTSDVARVVRELDLVSKYSASMYEMEFIRINLEGKTTTNSETDASCYFLHCNTLPVLDESGLFYYYTLRRDTYDTINGLYDPASAYNIEISPKRNLIRHGSFIRGCFYFQQASKLAFQTSNQNASLETVRNATMISAEERIKEGGDVLIGLLASPDFIPITFEFDSPVPMEIIEVMEANPSDTFTFFWEGQEFKGFPLDVSIQPANRPAQTTKLLCSPDSDILNLIH